MDRSISPPNLSFFRSAILPRFIFALLLLCVLWVYHPAQTRFFAMDQLMYQIELNGDRSWSAGLRLLDYSSERQFNKGDELLYRPLLMAGLAAQNALFQLDYRAWNGANLSAHLLAVWVLFESLWHLRRSPFAHAFALWFALLASNFDLVTWNHLGGYMLGYSLLLLAIMALRAALQHPDRQKSWCLYGLSIAPAMLFHEIAVVASVLAIAFAIPFLRQHPGSPRRTALLSMLAPLLLYGFLYAGHAARCERWLWIDTGNVDDSSLWMLPLHIFDSCKVWTLRILAPAAVEYDTHPLYRSGMSIPMGIASNIQILLQLGLWVILGVTLSRGITRTHLKSVAPFIGGLALLLAAYVAMNCWGRPLGVLDIPYYTYFGAMFGTPLLYSVVDFSQMGKTKQRLALALLALFCIFNAERTHRIGRRVEHEHAEYVHYFDAIDRQVRHRLDDPTFTFGIQNPPRDLDPLISISRGYPGKNGPSKVFSITDALYGPRYTPFLPSRWLSFNSE